jgi:creatinine amidohydrolase/Fe(II)-dependent formamide hydrolase-like protein
MKEISRGTGVADAPSFASREKGQRISNVVTEALVHMLRDIRESPNRLERRLSEAG